jgi:Mrp family chromosome partitioning ATPase
MLAAARLKHVMGPARSVVAVSSVDGRDCATALTARTAVALAEIEKENVLIVDANAVSSRMSRLFAIPGGPGLLDVLDERSDLGEALRCLEPSNLWLLPLGTCSRSMRSLVSSPGCAVLLKELRTRFRYVLVDAGNAGSAECMLMASASDGVVLALATGRTKEEAGRIQEELRRLQIPLLGVMLTSRTGKK